MKILLANDGSKSALAAAKYAVKLLGKLNSTNHHITLINVHDDTAFKRAASWVGKEAVSDYFLELSEKQLKSARKILDTANIAHDMEIKIGHVAEEIVASAKAGKFDLIVLGAKGRSAIADLLLGSVAHRVLATSMVPVLLVK
jgi:nucleotide-binding universal stress UspA family protein